MSTPYSTAFGTISVKDPAYGAVGDGSHDDTAAIQAAFNTAFGTTASPHGDSGRTTNLAVYFPPGNYKVTSTLTLRSVSGGRIYGNSSNSTRIFYAGAIAGGSTITALIQTNGFAYSSVSGLDLVISGTQTVCFNLDWDNTGSVALNANRFHDIICENATTGILIGVSGFMGSENSFLNCTFTLCTHAGLKTANGNALANIMISGGGSGCGTCVYSSTGSITLVAGASFSGNTLDINFNSGDACAAVGCRSESVDFASCVGAAFFGGCHHTLSSGAFIKTCTDQVCISGCTSAGVINGNPSAILAIVASYFPHANYLSGFSGLIQNVTFPAGAFSALPTASASLFGATAFVTDSTTATWGATITGTGSNKVMAFCNGTNWTVMGK